MSVERRGVRRTVVLPGELVELVEREARRRGMSFSEVVCWSIRETLARISHQLSSRGRGGACQCGFSTKMPPRRARGTSQATSLGEGPQWQADPRPQQDSGEKGGLIEDGPRALTFTGICDDPGLPPGAEIEEALGGMESR